MKKLVFFIFIFFIIFLAMPSKGTSTESEPTASDYQVIPDDAIRLRILANSDNETDQDIKRMVRDEVSGAISEWVAEIENIQDARKTIEEKMPEIKDVIARVLEQEGINQTFQAEYGKNVTFPHKIYGNYLYPGGEYEAVLITIGDGEGANWWCVLFPPLCFLDFSDGMSVAEKDAEKLETIGETSGDDEASAISEKNAKNEKATVNQANTEDDSKIDADTAGNGNGKGEQDLTEKTDAASEQELTEKTDAASEQELTEKTDAPAEKDKKEAADSEPEEKKEEDTDDKLEIKFFLFEWLGWS